MYAEEKTKHIENGIQKLFLERYSLIKIIDFFWLFHLTH